MPYRKSFVRMMVIAGLLAAATVVAPSAPAFADDIRDRQWMLDALDLTRAHEIATGEGVVVGMVDTGVDATHPDLTGQVIGGRDTWSTAHDGQRDAWGHGTGMASLIAGHGHGPDGSQGVLGVAPGAKILSYGALPAGETSYDNAELATAIEWLTANGADVIYLGYGGGTSYEPEENAIKAAVAAGIPVVTGSGNTNEGTGTIGSPANYHDVIMVTGTDEKGKPSKISIDDANSAIAAPCDDIVAATTDGGYDTNSGTSNSAAIVTGVIALIKSHWPDITLEDTVRRLATTAVDAGDEGQDRYYGYGIADPVAALTEVVELYDPSQSPHVVGDPYYASDEPADAAEAAGDRGGLVTAFVIGGAAVVAVLAAVIILLARRRRRGH